MSKPKSSKPKILVQLDCDPHASVFDSVVAVDAGVDQLLCHHQVSPDDVRELIYGAMFTRGPRDLSATAIFIGGSSVETGEQLLRRVEDCFFSSVRVSVMLDSSGANTTAAAAVLAADRHLALDGAVSLVMGATGPVGRRVVRLLAGQGAQVRVASRSQQRAQQLCSELLHKLPDGKFSPYSIDTPEGIDAALDGAQVVVAAGTPGVQLLPQKDRQSCKTLQVAIDLNAVPPLGIEGTEVADQGTQREGALCYGAIGVGGTKMKIHKAAIRRLFEANDLVLDAEQIYQIGQGLLRSDT